MDEKTRKFLTPYHSKPPHLYGLPKVHKKDYPLRPIVSSIGSPTYNLEKFLLEILKPLAGKTNSHIKNSQDFINKIKTTTIKEGEIQVSFDIVSLFTNVPTNEAIAIVKKRLEQDTKLPERTNLSVDAVIELLDLCSNTTYFQFNDIFLKQTKGRAMGSALSPILSDIYMEEFENDVINTAKTKPTIWYRYVDDTYVIWPENEQKVEDFLDFINSKCPSIKFTMEKEKNGSLPFLDVKITRKEKNLHTSVYRKNTDSGRYLHFTSNHPETTKKAIAHTLLMRAETHCSTEKEKRKEIIQVKKTLKNNGYPNKIVNTVNKQENKNSDTQIKPFGTMVIPYIRGFSEKIRKIGQKLNIRTAFTSRNTFKKQLCHTKPEEKEKTDKNCIYSIPCECGNEYIGETGRPLKVRVKEHQKKVEKKQYYSSKLAEHVKDNKHKIKWENTTVLARENNWKYRKIEEAIEMSMRENIISQPSFEIDKMWIPILKQERERNSGGVRSGFSTRVRRATSEQANSSMSNLARRDASISMIHTNTLVTDSNKNESDVTARVKEVRRPEITLRQNTVPTSPSTENYSLQQQNTLKFKRQSRHSNSLRMGLDQPRKLARPVQH